MHSACLKTGSAPSSFYLFSKHVLRADCAPTLHWAWGHTRDKNSHARVQSSEEQKQVNKQLINSLINFVI